MSTTPNPAAPPADAEPLEHAVEAAESNPYRQSPDLGNKGLAPTSHAVQAYAPPREKSITGWPIQAPDTTKQEI
ncbi:hypothetical protein BJH93_01945 [Kocuria polaris]|nr:hypothetical protein [Kocuria polaris]